MKIAFDATVVHGRKSGVGYYSQELVRALAKLEGDEEYFVFSHRPLTGEVVAEGPRMRFAAGRFCPVRAVYLHALLPGLLAREGPDLVHYTNFLAPVRSRHPYVLTVHDMSLERLSGAHPLAKRVYTKRLVPGAVRGARLILTNSEFSKWDTVRYLGVSEDRIRVTPLAVSAQFHPVSGRARDAVLEGHGIRRPYFLYVGNLEPRKNLERLLDAFSAVPASEHALVIAGNSWFRGNRVFRKAREVGLGERVRFLGYVPRADLPALMSGATGFVYPSLLEGFGLPVLEAMACGTPVITSATTALGEIAGGAALRVDPTRVDALADALAAVAGDSGLAAALAGKGLRRAAAFSWEATARATREAYRDALDRERPSVSAVPPATAVSDARLGEAILSTLDYADQFDYPLTPAELRDRLFDVPASPEHLESALRELDLGIEEGYLARRPGLGRIRIERERRTARVLEAFRRELAFVASVPFVRMLAFSGATAHENMADDDVDLFAVVEDGKLWAVVAGITLWAKARGLRRNICLNYVVSERALPLFETDLFTAQQAASLKPFYGKAVYDRFLQANPFLRRVFPNFDASRHRDRYPELAEPRFKSFLEAVLRWGPVQVAERLSRKIWGRHLEAKRAAACSDESDVLLETRRIKLHLNSHRRKVLGGIASGGGANSAVESVPGSFAPAVTEGPEENAKVQHQ